MDSVDLDTAVSIDISGLGTLDWHPTGVTATCLSSCSSMLTAPLQIARDPLRLFTAQS
ncbi:hypothetical protein [Rhodococcus tukisamuensis]|uniref:hypothetical protein n=1 Tax=Rhodococcus tukisamuensis TaxID=168276 RepID=UPI0014758E07|nr:hypothetical protein [Rhodococcus tukisamuensis]